MLEVMILNARPDDAEVICHIGGYFPCGPESPTPDNIRKHIQQFPEGQLVALLNHQIVGFALTMRTHRSPDDHSLPWLDAIGDLDISNHDPAGEWLYGIDFVVDANYRRQGIGSKLYQARFNLVKQFNLRGFYAGGMLLGYQQYRHQMSIRQYAEKVQRGEIYDPTVTMQMKRGFHPYRLIENYSCYPAAGNAAMLIVWNNPQHREIPM